MDAKVIVNSPWRRVGLWRANKNYLWQEPEGRKIADKVRVCYTYDGANASLAKVLPAVALLGEKKSSIA